MAEDLQAAVDAATAAFARASELLARGPEEVAPLLPMEPLATADLLSSKQARAVRPPRRRRQQPTAEESEAAGDGADGVEAAPASEWHDLLKSRALPPLKTLGEVPVLRMARERAEARARAQSLPRIQPKKKAHSLVKPPPERPPGLRKVGFRKAASARPPLASPAAPPSPAPDPVPAAPARGTATEADIWSSQAKQRVAEAIRRRKQAQIEDELHKARAQEEKEVRAAAAEEIRAKIVRRAALRERERKERDAEEQQAVEAAEAAKAARRAVSSSEAQRRAAECALRVAARLAAARRAEQAAKAAQLQSRALASRRSEVMGDALQREAQERVKERAAQRRARVTHAEVQHRHEDLRLKSVHEVNERIVDAARQLARQRVGRRRSRRSPPPEPPAVPLSPALDKCPPPHHRSDGGKVEVLFIDDEEGGGGAGDGGTHDDGLSYVQLSQAPGMHPRPLRVTGDIAPLPIPVAVNSPRANRGAASPRAATVHLGEDAGQGWREGAVGADHSVPGDDAGRSAQSTARRPADRASPVRVARRKVPIWRREPVPLVPLHR